MVTMVVTSDRFYCAENEQCHPLLFTRIITAHTLLNVVIL